MNVDPLSTSLYFTAAANASKEAQKEKNRQKTEKTKKSAFASMVEKNQEIEKLVSSGLPPEIAGLSVEDAAVYLKDALEIAGDKLSENKNAENFAEFRKTVSQFLRFVEKNAFEVEKIKLPNTIARQRVRVRHLSPYLQETRLRDPHYQIRIVNQRLEEIAAMILQNQADNLNLLSKVDEIRGLVVDFFAI